MRPQNEHAKRVIELIEECIEHSSKSRTIPYWIINEAFLKGMDILKTNDNAFYDYSLMFWFTVRESMEEEFDTYYDDGWVRDTKGIKVDCKSDYNDDGLCTTDPSDRNYRI